MWLGYGHFEYSSPEGLAACPYEGAETGIRMVSKSNRRFLFVFVIVRSSVAISFNVSMRSLDFLYVHI